MKKEEKKLVQIIQAPKEGGLPLFCKNMELHTLNGNAEVFRLEECSKLRAKGYLCGYSYPAFKHISRIVEYK